MGLIFTGTWEQAVLTAIAKTAARHPNEGYLGRTAIQKIAYFLQIGGVPLRYPFDIYHYGPYCDRVTRDVELLVADGALKDVSTSADRYSNYRPADVAGEVLDLHTERLQQYQPVIDALVETLLPLEPARLELLATLDYLYRQLRAGSGTGPWKAQVVQRFLEVKKDKFSPEQVATAYDGMAKAGLFQE